MVGMCGSCGWGRNFTPKVCMLVVWVVEGTYGEIRVFVFTGY